MAKFKIAVAVILAILLLVIIIQNTESVQTTLLFVTVELPRAALLFIAMLIGFVLGLLAAFSLSGKSRSAG